MTITNQQVIRLKQMIHKYNQEISAAKSGMNVKTARKYLSTNKTPSELKRERHWKTRGNVFEENWDNIEAMLHKAPGLQAKTILSYLVSEQPDKFNDSHERTLQRLLRKWRANNGSNNNIIFNQRIRPGEQSQSDYTSMNKLCISINGNVFEHLLFHFMLPYSKWEYASICYSESFNSLSQGYEEAVWTLGYTAPEHRTDNLSAASKRVGNKRVSTDNWKEFMKHYLVTPSRNNPGKSNENGSIEKSHDLLKSDIRQQLMLRGSNDFSSIDEYEEFLQKIIVRRNKTRSDKVSEEIKLLKPLPEKKYYAPEILELTVTKSSTIRIHQVTYSVPSRLIDYNLRAYIYRGEIKLYYGAQLICKMLKIDKSRASAVINYRHIIAGLVRKPGAFTNYHYKDHLFPTVVFRKLYDRLVKTYPVNGTKQYLQILHLAAMNSESEVEAAISILMEGKIAPTINRIKELLYIKSQAKVEVHVDQPVVKQYDSLLELVA
jgi:hypothetical protein